MGNYSIPCLCNHGITSSTSVPRSDDNTTMMTLSEDWAGLCASCPVVVLWSGHTDSALSTQACQEHCGRRGVARLCRHPPLVLCCDNSEAVCGSSPLPLQLCATPTPPSLSNESFSLQGGIMFFYELMPSSSPEWKGKTHILRQSIICCTRQHVSCPWLQLVKEQEAYLRNDLRRYFFWQPSQWAQSHHPQWIAAWDEYTLYILHSNYGLQGSTMVQYVEMTQQKRKQYVDPTASHGEKNRFLLLQYANIITDNCLSQKYSLCPSVLLDNIVYIILYIINSYSPCWTDKIHKSSIKLHP